jgi:putative Mn2+ efflux pump MntP
MTRTLWLLLALAGALLLAWQGTVTPAPLPASAPATAFSAERALVDIRRIAREPHPIGSPANDRVRAFLLQRMTALGLSPQVQVADVLSPPHDADGVWLSGAHVRNVIGVLPGRDRRAPALLLMAHYDSVSASPGAADDSTGVASALEVVRALKARGTPARDVIVLITDGEEFALSGAEAFFNQNPLSRRVGLIINMEARGGGGRANMFQTGADNGALIDVFKTSAIKPISSALAVFLYEKMPNDTDFSVSKAKGLSGLNFAFIGRQFDYHSPTSTVANLDPGSVQSMGQQVLAAAGDLAFAPALPGKAPSAVYSQTFGDHVLAYPAWAGWIVLLLIGVMLMVAGWRARRAGADLKWRDGLKGAAGGLLILTASALALNLARRVTGAGFGFFEQRTLLAQWPIWETCLILVGLGVVLLVPALMARQTKRLWPALAAVVGGVLCSLFGGFDLTGLVLGLITAGLAAIALGRPTAPAGGWAGLLILAFVMTGLLQVFVPQVAFLMAWPLALAALAAALSRWGEDGRLGPMMAVLAAVALGWLGVYVHLTSQGLDLPALLGLFSLLAAFSLWPLAQTAASSDRETWLGVAPAAAALIAALGLLLFLRFSDPWTDRYPQATNIMHVAETASGRAWLATPDQTDWTRGVLAAGGATISKASLPPFAEEPTFVAPTPFITVPTPAFSSKVQPDGRVVLTLTPTPGVRNIRINLETDVAVADVRVQGAPARWLEKPKTWYRLRWVGDGAPLTISFKPAGKGVAEIDYATVEDRWPTAARVLPARPPRVMPFGLSDSTVVTGRALVRW